MKSAYQIDKINKIRINKTDKTCESSEPFLLTSGEEEDLLLDELMIGKAKKALKKVIAPIEKIKHITEKYGVNILVKKDLQKLCVKYFLKCVTAKYYTKLPPDKLGVTVKAFCDKHDLLFSPEKIYFLAPAEDFGKSKKVVAKKEPTVLYRVEGETLGLTNSDVFLEIEGFGETVSSFRNVLWCLEAFAKNSSTSPPFIQTVIIIIMSILASMFALCNTTLGDALSLALMIISLILTAFLYINLQKGFKDGVWYATKASLISYNTI